MCKSIIRSALLAILLLGFSIPGAALAGGGEKGCSNIGTWIGIAGPDDMSPAGWITTVIGKSNNEGVNVIEFPNYDPTLGIPLPPFKDAVLISNSRGNWVRTGGNTFDYTFTGFALDAENEPVYISKISGQVTIYGDCQFQYITAYLEAYAPDENPFTGVRLNPEPFYLGEFYGYRASVDLPF